jgi:hypothetical protein
MHVDYYLMANSYEVSEKVRGVFVSMEQRALPKGAQQALKLIFNQSRQNNELVLPDGHEQRLEWIKQSYLRFIEIVRQNELSSGPPEFEW